MAGIGKTSFDGLRIFGDRRLDHRLLNTFESMAQTPREPCLPSFKTRPGSRETVPEVGLDGGRVGFYTWGFEVGRIGVIWMVLDMCWDYL